MSNRLPLEVSNLAISFVYLSHCLDFRSVKMLRLQYKSGAQVVLMSEEAKISICLFGPYFVSTFPFIFSCVGVGRNVKKSPAGSWDMHWKEREESLWSLFSGQPMEFWHFCLYWRSPTSSRSCDQKEE